MAAAIIDAATALIDGFAFTLLRFTGEADDEKEPDEEEPDEEEPDEEEPDEEDPDEEEPDEEDPDEELFFKLALFAGTFFAGAFLREARTFLGFSGFSTRRFNSARRANCFICHGPPLA